MATVPVTKMTIENAIRVLAGSMVLAGVFLAWIASPWWLLLPAFVGANLLQSAFTHVCPAEHVLRRLGVGRADGPSRAERS